MFARQTWKAYGIKCVERTWGRAGIPQQNSTATVPDL